MDFDGTADAEGSGLQLLATARAEGTFKGRSVSFAPDADFRTATGRFELKERGMETFQYRNHPGLGLTYRRRRVPA